MLPPPTILPRATYRVQPHGLGFRAIADLVSYLARLGVSHLYLAPILQARTGSTHGYDVVDHSRIDESLGGEKAWRELVDACRKHHLAILLDVVPNHMAIDDPANRWWWDVLEDAHASRYAHHFDVDWESPEERLRHQILLPVLGDHYGRELEAGKFSLERCGGDVRVRYGDRIFPVSPRSLREPLGAAARLARDPRLEHLADAFGALPGSHETDIESIERRHADKGHLRRELDTLCRSDAAIAKAVDDTLTAIASDPNQFDELLQRQNYRLAFWRAGSRELDYRRFFDIAELAALRVEDGRVFDETHKVVVELIARGDVAGLRIDHPDGLSDPQEYLARVNDDAPGAWIVVEKILQPGERLRPDWDTHGTTGYEFLNLVNGLFVDPRAEFAFTHLFAELSGEGRSFDEIALEARREILRTALAPDVQRLTELGTRIIERHRRYRDYTRADVRATLRELAAAFRVYRSYVRADEGVIADEDKRLIASAVARALERTPELDRDLTEFFSSVLCLESGGDLEREMAMRFQQLTAPTAAKGVEDTAFYRYVRLAGLCEVGGDPSRFGTTVEEFHAANVERLRANPFSLLTTSTHDTKRSEDVRLRIDALSEVPEHWRAAVGRWRERLAGHRGVVDGAAECLLLQTLVGAWPIEEVRLASYMEKAAREAKIRTSWTTPNADYEHDLRALVAAIYRDRALRADIERFIAPIERAARVHSLAQTLLKLTSPGVPDLYQGSELWTNDLVDPDNRRPVDWEERRALLRRVEGDATRAHPKLHLIARALALRARRPKSFGADGTYEPLAPRGSRADRVVAFFRGDDVLVVTPRLVLSLDGWEDTALALPRGSWRDALTGTRHDGVVGMERLLGNVGVALLERA
ncbi:MAG: malto-oligosyltrehalose synthase [Chloroflexi bacterium 13_1_40CM_4_68_4]|nr:MAG: malto-oligosyltrehalose synthase [Chloroflexi bacterium 13_1_40CM_4_68_4]